MVLTMPTSKLLVPVLSTLAITIAASGTVAAAAPPRCAGQVVTVRIGVGQHATNGDDVILGTPRRDIIHAGRGNDVVCAQGGADDVFGGRGADTLYGEGGDDDVYGQRGNDRVFGGKGGDYVAGNAGTDFCSRGPYDVGDEGDTTCESGNGSA
jgi:Ca2+-binding RTX toxin-like protein